MQYFKHMTNMRNDIKIKRLIAKYGLEGYGLYNLILESITESLTTDSPIPDLQETCEDIAEFYNGNTARINEIAAFMVGQGLIELDEISTRITCIKIYKYLEQSQTRSKQIREMIGSYKTNAKISNCTDIVVSQTVCDKSERIEENRIEENRIEEKPKDKKHKYGEYKNVLLTDKEKEKLLEKFGKDTDYWINKLDFGIEQKGYKYKSHYLTILNWYARDNEQQQPTKSAYPDSIPNL